jgi:hypothetical protein
MKSLRLASLARAAALGAALVLLSFGAVAAAEVEEPGRYLVTRFGARGDGTTNDAPAIQRAIDACTKAGGGRVVLPPGRTWVAGTFFLKDNVELVVERGAVLITSPRREDFLEGKGWLAMVRADGARNIGISGGGEINGRGPFYMTSEEPQIYRARGWRPNPILLRDCENVRIRDVSILSSASWTLTLDGCADVLISGIRIVNDLRIPNDDGIDICSSRDVRVSDSYIEAGDDAIVVKALVNERGGATKPSENVTVTNCILKSRSFALNLGCEAKAPLRNMTFDNIVVRDSHRGVGIHLSQGADVENILFSNMVIETRLFHEDWWGRGEPIYVVAIPWTHDDTIGVVRNVRFSHVLARGEQGVFVWGWTPDRIQGLVFDDVQVEVDKWSEFRGGRFDLRPWPGEVVTENILVEHPTAGFFLRNATDVTLRNCRVSWGKNRQPYFRHALEAEGVAGLAVEGFRGEAAWPGKDAAQRIVPDPVPAGRKP